MNKIIFTTRACLWCVKLLVSMAGNQGCKYTWRYPLKCPLLCFRHDAIRIPFWTDVSGSEPSWVSLVSSTPAPLWLLRSSNFSWWWFSARWGTVFPFTKQNFFHFDELFYQDVWSFYIRKLSIYRRNHSTAVMAVSNTEYSGGLDNFNSILILNHFGSFFSYCWRGSVELTP